MPEKTVAQNDGGVPTERQESTREQETYVRPPVDIFESGDGLTVVADLPGVSRDQLSIDVKDNVLTIAGRTRTADSGQPTYREFELFNYYRQFELSDSVDVAKISAELKNGVLTLHLPKSAEARPKRIEVKLG